jgi:hypothetical protein
VAAVLDLAVGPCPDSGVLRSRDVGARVVQERLAMTAAIWQPDRVHDTSRRIASLR